MEERKEVSPALREYVEKEIIPRYSSFDPAHREDHARKVISSSLYLAGFYPVDMDMVYAAAAFHDTGLVEGRDTHHIASARIIREDPFLSGFFTREQIETIAQAAQDHRASSKNPPGTIYGKIVAEADRDIRPETIIRRTIQYSIGHYPDFGKAQHWERCHAHLIEKYGDGGYLHLFLPESPNRGNLETLRSIIRDETLLRSEFDRIWEELGLGN